MMKQWALEIAMKAMAGARFEFDRDGLSVNLGGKLPETE